MLRFRDNAAEEWLRSKTASLLGGLKARWYGKVQGILASGLEKGHNPKSVGLELVGRVNPKSGKREGGSICLGEAEQRQVSDVNRCLTDLDEHYFTYDLRDKRFDRSVSRAISEGRSLAQDKICLLVDRFEAKLLKHYADMFAATQMLTAINRSEWLSTKSAFEISGLPASACSRIWDSCGDEKVRPSHRLLDEKCIVGFQECFVSPLTGAKMMYPGDTSMGAPEDEVRGCRCRIRYKIDFAAGLR